VVSNCRLDGEPARLQALPHVAWPPSGAPPCVSLLLARQWTIITGLMVAAIGFFTPPAKAKPLRERSVRESSILPIYGILIQVLESLSEVYSIVR
jgi:hypothetical protein